MACAMSATGRTSNSPTKQTGRGSHFPRPFLCFQKRNVLVNRCPAQITYPSQLGHIQLPVLIRRIVAQKSRRDIVGGYLRSADFSSLGGGIRHPTTHSRPNHSKLKLAEYFSQSLHPDYTKITPALAAIYCSNNTSGYRI